MCTCGPLTTLKYQELITANQNEYDSIDIKLMELMMLMLCAEVKQLSAVHNTNKFAFRMGYL